MKHRPAKSILLQLQQAPFLLLLSAFIVGILVADNFYGLPLLLWAGLFFAFLSMLLLLHAKRTLAASYGILRFVFVVGTLASLGGLVCNLNKPQTQKTWVGHHLQNARALSGSVVAPPRQTEKTWSYKIALNKLYANGRWQRVSGIINLYIYKADSAKIFAQGNELLLPASLRPIENSGNPFAFDYQLFMARKGVYHQLLTASDKVSVIAKGKGEGRTGRFRNYIAHCIDRSIAQADVAGLAKAILINDRVQLDDALQQAYATTGITHIIAISGMHILLLASVLSWAVRFIKLETWRRIYLSAIVLIVWLYLALTGFPPSGIRAGIMYTALAMATVLGLQGNSLNAWAMAAFFMLVFNPGWLYDVGAQLSFMAVLSILLFYQPIRKLLSPPTKILRWLWEAVALGLAVQILVFPIVVYYFHQFPVWVLLANLPAGLFSTVLMAAGVAVILLYTLRLFAVAKIVGSVVIFMANNFHELIKWLATHSPDVSRNIYLSYLQLLLLLVFTFCCARFFLIESSKWYLYASILFFGLFGIDKLATQFRAMGQDKLVVYNTNGSVIDHFRGLGATHYRTTNAQVQKYVQMPALSGFQTKSRVWDTAQNLQIFKASGMTVLLCRSFDAATVKPLDVDILVLDKLCAYRPKEWSAAFHPRWIILDGSFGSYKGRKWQHDLRQLGARVHYVREDGAFIYPKK
ncbi:MAG: ComEC/Rec2 family competence protein [Edaphocola sp.]